MSNRPCILIVDDEPINIQIMEKVLRNEYDVISALNGYDAIHQAKEKHPDLILLDVMMPELSGFDVCKILKSDEAFADIPIIFLTAMDAMVGEVMALELGGMDYLPKPVNFDLLKLRVRNHIELKKRSDLIREQRDLLVAQKIELEEALGRVKRLEGIIPICMFCKKIRDDKNDWNQLERYISDHSEAMFSHGICPHCAEEQYGIIKTIE